MKKLIVGALTAVGLVASSAHAEQGIAFTLASDHVGAKAQYNQRNLGVGYFWDTNIRYLGDVNAQVGVYRNSEYNTSAYVSATKYLWSSSGKGVRAGYAVGLATGYDSPLMPIIAGVATINVRYFDVNIIVSGYRDSNGDNKIKPLLGLQVAFPF